MIDINTISNKPEVIDNLNKVGLTELGKRIQAMTDEEKRVVVDNIPISMCLDRVGLEFDRLYSIEKSLVDMMKKFEK